jgi:hypothetical protein
MQQDAKIQFISFWMYVNICLIATSFYTYICLWGLYSSVLLPVLLRNVRLTAVHKLICILYVWTYRKIAIQLFIVCLCMWLNLLYFQMCCTLTQPVHLCLELMGYRSICVPHWQRWFSKTGTQLIVSCLVSLL